jgi:hypothetical protein
MCSIGCVVGLSGPLWMWVKTLKLRHLKSLKLTQLCRTSRKSGALTDRISHGPVQACNGTALQYILSGQDAATKIARARWSLGLTGAHYVKITNFQSIFSHYNIFFFSAYSWKSNYEVLLRFYWEVTLKITYRAKLKRAQFRCTFTGKHETWRCVAPRKLWLPHICCFIILPCHEVGNKIIQHQQIDKYIQAGTSTQSHISRTVCSLGYCRLCSRLLNFRYVNYPNKLKSLTILA